MKLLILKVLLFQLVALQSCADTGGEGKAEFWLNIKYVECLRISLPCECEKAVGTYHALLLDTNNLSSNQAIRLWEFNENEPDLYSLKKIGRFEFEAIKVSDNNGPSIRLSIKRDSLFIIRGGLLSKFIKSKGLRGNDININPLEIANIVLLNKSLSTRGYPILERIVKENSLRCTCNKWMGNVNFLYVRGVSKSWTMEIVGKKLLIKKITNVDRDPDDPVQTEEVASYNWK